VACIDTTVVVDLLRRHGPRLRAATTKLREVITRGETLSVTRISEAELWVGIARSTDPAGEQRRVYHILATHVMLDFDAAAAQRFGQVKARLLKLGKPIGDLDATIAAICLARGERLISANPRHFADIPGLVVESYA
jgi:tRNA(fMet)-specific endonuclease VapC